MTGRGELEVRRAVDADRAAILDLLRVSLGREVDDRYEALFRWKHLDNAFGPSPAWLACDGERIVGFRTLMRWEFEAPADAAETGATGEPGPRRRLRAVRAVDTATHPDYQGRGIFTRLTLAAIDELAAEGVDFVFNTPNDQSRPGYLKMGWQVVGSLPTAVRPTRWTRLARIAQARVPAERWSSPSDAGMPAVDVLADTPALTRLLAARAPTRGVATALSPEYLRWRFGTDLLGYRAVVAPGGVEHGISIFRVRRRGAARECALGAVIVPAGARRTAVALARSVARTVDADYLLGLGGPVVWPGGLVRLPRVGPVLTSRAVAGSPPQQWDLTLGDIELF